VLCGGLFGGLQPASALKLPLDHADMKAAGTSMGCGAFHLMSSRGCPVELVTDAVSYLARQSAQQCGVCFKGTASMAATLQQLARGEADAAALVPLVRWSTGLKGRGNCALLDAACELVGSLFRHWQAAVDAHLTDAACPVCRGRADFSKTRLAVSPDTFLPPPLEERP
jgi:NADH:ubiquinone oxidoreductase subunit F (NADH-binding)